MLTWDEEVKPSLPKDLQQGLRHTSNSGTQVGRSTEVPTSQIAPPLSSASPVARTLDDGAAVRPAQAMSSSVAPVAHRVKAADKRIINGQTDVNQLVPF